MSPRSEIEDAQDENGAIRCARAGISLLLGALMLGCGDQAPNSLGGLREAELEAGAGVPVDERPVVTLAAALGGEEDQSADDREGASPPDTSEEAADDAQEEEPEPAAEEMPDEPEEIAEPTPAPEPDPLTIYAGVYNRGQAARGADIVRKECSTCHRPDVWSDGQLLQRFAGRTAYELVAHIQSAMPLDSPGRLTAQQYTDVVAYLFELNGVPAGTGEMSTEEARLRQLQVEYRP